MLIKQWRFTPIQIDPIDPSFEVPNLLSVGGQLNVIGHATLNSALVSHVTLASTSSFTCGFTETFILCPPGATRNAVINPGFDGRILILKDVGQASSTNITITDVNGRMIDGAWSYKITNDYGSVRMMFDFTRNKWWTF